jgi:wyosine [tRNA(Phe)-imidazoG37] synthetase (radical SAM superfamily)
MKYKYIVGPIISRRLGVSLGIDPIPSKTCSFDCLYCEVKKTNNKTIERKEYVNADEILFELKDYLKNSNKKLDYITFSGSGEPTLNSKIGYIINEIKKITDTPVAVITNSSIIDRKEVRDDLLNADLIVPSLDAVTESVFKKIDLPHHSIKIENIIEGLISLRKEYKGQIWLEILVLKGYNDTEDEIKKLAEVIKKIKPNKIQLNSLDRAPAYGVAKKVDSETLENLKLILGEIAEVV